MKTRRIAYREYMDPGAEKIGVHNARYGDAEYSVAMLGFPILCADIVAISRGRKTFFLAHRNLQPKKGWWCIGGRVLRGEPFIVAALRKLRQETGLELNADRLTFVAFHRYISPLREQWPQEHGADTPTLVFSFEPTVDELATISASLDKKEYLDEGLREFTLEQMIEEDVNPALIALHGDIFAR